MTLRQPGKYKRINGSCQLDSIQKIIPRGWPIPCSSARSPNYRFACSPVASRSKISHLFLWAQTQNPQHGAVRKLKKNGPPSRQDLLSQRLYSTYRGSLSASQRVPDRPRIAPSNGFPQHTAPPAVSSLPTQPTATALPRLPTHLHCLGRSNFHREFG